MPTYLLAPLMSGARSGDADEHPATLLATKTEELAGLRLSVILTAKWGTSAGVDPEQREELRTELVGLRRRYSEKIDEIAMTLGVQNAMESKEYVERTVVIQPGMKPPLRHSDRDRLTDGTRTTRGGGGLEP
jgi:hypothetical protein